MLSQSIASMHLLKSKGSCKTSSYSFSDPNKPSPHLLSYFLQTHFSTIPHLLLCLPSGILPTDVSTKTLYVCSLLFHACYMPRPLHSPSFDHTNNLRITHKLRTSSLCNIIFSGLQLPPSPNLTLSARFSNTSSLCSALFMIYQDSHPHSCKRQQKYSFVCLNLHNFRQETTMHKNPNRIHALLKFKLL